jgi:hypothetical protein
MLFYYAKYLSELPPNTALELTPLRGAKIAAILKPGFSPRAFPISGCGAAHAHAVSPLLSSLVLIELALWFVSVVYCLAS